MTPADHLFVRELQQRGGEMAVRVVTTPKGERYFSMNKEERKRLAEIAKKEHATAASLLRKELPELEWWVVDHNHQDQKLRGPYKHDETAGVVRGIMEENASDNKRWNLWVMPFVKEAA